MPDTRRRRGPHPKDDLLFQGRWVPILQTAVGELSWLLSRGYSARAAVKLVGDRHALRDRQRRAIQRCAASTSACRERQSKMVDTSELAGETIVIDGFNVLLTLETALSGGLLLLARDQALRDLAAMSAHYRRLLTTSTALELLAGSITEWNCREAICYLDRPVSNSGRLKRLIQATVADSGVPWRVDLTDRTDRLLIASPFVVASADSAVLDGCRRWSNLARAVIEQHLPHAWILDLRVAPG